MASVDLNPLFRLAVEFLLQSCVSGAAFSICFLSPRQILCRSDPQRPQKVIILQPIQTNIFYSKGSWCKTSRARYADSIAGVDLSPRCRPGVEFFLSCCVRLRQSEIFSEFCFCIVAHKFLGRVDTNDG